MATRTIADYVASGGVPQNGVAVTAYKASRFGGIPAQGTVPPVGGPDAGPVISGLAFGGPGVWEIVCPTVEDYYCTGVIGGQQAWQFYPAAAAATVPASPFLVTGAPPANVNQAALELGGGVFGGGAGTFLGLAAGTGIAVNLVSASTADLMNLQVAGVSQFSVATGGTVTAAGSIMGADMRGLYFQSGTAAGIYIQTSNSDMTFVARSGGVLKLQPDVRLTRGAAFWGHAAVGSQPAAPVTLADVIAIISGCGLSA